MKRIRVYYWSPFIDKVATTKAVLNSVLSLNTYSKKNFEGIIINVFGEWLNYNSNSNSFIKFYDLNNLNFLKKFSSRGFFKSRLKYLLIFILSYFPLKKFLKKEKPEFLIIHLITSLPLFLNLTNNFDTKIILRISGKPQLNTLRYFFWRHALKKVYKITFPTLETLNFFKSLNIVNVSKLELLHDPIIHTRHLAKMKNEKLVKSVRGPSGGYILEKNPKEIRISNIIFAVDEQVKTLNCKRESKKGCNGKTIKCITHNLWDDLENHINNFFEKVSLNDVVKQRNIETK